MNKRIIQSEQQFSQIEHSFSLLKCQKEDNIFSIKDEINKLITHKCRHSRLLKEIQGKFETVNFAQQTEMEEIRDQIKYILN
jgi:hypothetical protein